jgi:hypothetical protein
MADGTTYDEAVKIGQKLAEENSTVTETATESSPTVTVTETKGVKADKK